jgi:hypothetical protein
MELIIPAEALRAGVVVGSLVFVVLNAVGEVSGLFVRNVGLGASAVSGSLVSCAAGSIAGTVTAEAVKGMTDGYFVPAVKRGAQASGFSIATGAGVATVVVVTIGIFGGRYVLNKIRAARPQDFTPIDYDCYEDSGFDVLSLNAVLGNPEGTPHTPQTNQKN